MSLSTKRKVTFIFDPNVCSYCGATTEGNNVTVKFLVDQIERRFVFCESCIAGDPSEERCKELLRKSIRCEDAIARGDEQVKKLLDDLPSR